MIGGARRSPLIHFHSGAPRSESFAEGSIELTSEPLLLPVKRFSTGFAADTGCGTCGILPADADGMLQSDLSLNILLIDDNPVVLRALRTVLGLNPNWKIVGEAESGAEGLRMFRETTPDVVIVDFQMPGMNGLEVGKEIRRTNVSVLLFLFTLHAGTEMEMLAKKAGFDGVFSKTTPYPIVAIIEQMRRAPGHTSSAMLQPEVVDASASKEQATSSGRE